MQSHDISQSALAYIEQATIELIEERKFKFSNQAELKLWMEENSKAIINRSKDLQIAFFNKVQAHQSEVSHILSASLWHKIRVGNIENNLQTETNKIVK